MSKTMNKFSPEVRKRAGEYISIKYTERLAEGRDRALGRKRRCLLESTGNIPPADRLDRSSARHQGYPMHPGWPGHAVAPTQAQLDRAWS